MKKFDQNEAEIYDKKIRLAIPEYDLFHGLLCSLSAVFLRQSEYPRALVIGAGTGHEVFELLKKNQNLTIDALEPSGEMREVLESHLLKNTLGSRVNIFPETLQTFLSTEKYDFITSILVFQFIPSIKEKEYFLSKISELLKAQGKAVMFEMIRFQDLDPWSLDVWGERLSDLGVSKDIVSQMKKNLQEKFAPISEKELRQISQNVGLKMSESFYQVLNFKAYYFEKT